MKNLKSKGQSLLLVIVAMTIALTVGLAITNRTLSSLKRTSSSDTAARVFSAAEGGIEWFLRQPVSVLEKLSDGDTLSGTECPAGTSGDIDNVGCVISYQPQENDKILSKALITVKSFSLNFIENGNSNYWFTLSPGGVKEVALKDYRTDEFYHGNIDVCWKSLEAVQSSALYFTTYNGTGIQEKRIVSPNTIQPGTVFNMTGDTTADQGRLEYSSCYSINIADDTDVLGLRIKSLYAPSKIAVFPDTDGFPTQGYQITSLGQLDNTSEKIKATREIKVYRSLPYAPAIFDYGIYSSEAID